jgi:hypothetical protein
MWWTRGFGWEICEILMGICERQTKDELSVEAKSIPRRILKAIDN